MVVVVLLAVISEMTGVVAVQIGASRRYDGPMGKSDRAFLFGLLALLGGLGVAFRTGGAPTSLVINRSSFNFSFAFTWADLALAVAALMLGITIINRARGALKEVAGKP